MEDYYLRALEPSDYKEIFRWRSDPTSSAAVAGQSRVISEEIEREWVLSQIKKHAGGEILRFVICEIEGSKPVGLWSVSDFDFVNRTCFSSGVLIAPEERGKKIMSKARKLVFDYLFYELNMQKIKGSALVINDASIKNIERSGYVKEGVLRREVYKHGEYHDLVLYGILKEEYEER